MPKKKTYKYFYNKKANRLQSTDGKFIKYNPQIKRYIRKSDLRIINNLFILTAEIIAKKQATTKKYKYMSIYLDKKKLNKEREGKVYSKDKNKYIQATLTKDKSLQSEERYVMTTIKTWIVLVHPKNSPIVFTKPNERLEGSRSFEEISRMFGLKWLLREIDEAKEKGYKILDFSMTYKIYHRVAKAFFAYKNFDSPEKLRNEIQKYQG